jgi:thymidylate synthase (FAD)
MLRKYEDALQIKLVSCTQPVIDEASNIDELIAYCARVSNPANQANKETADKLVQYLIKHKHWSPLDMADATVEISTTRDIGRQMLRHLSFKFQEFSQRYAEAQEFVLREARMQDTKNRQNSLICVDEELQGWWEAEQRIVIATCESTYNRALKKGIAKEQARVVLPEGLTMSRLYMKGSIRSWIHYLEVRRDESTQKEHRMLAVAIAEAISQITNLIK